MKASLWQAPPLLLASKSQGRAGILRGAGIPFDVVVADVDERAIEKNFGGTPVELAQELAIRKALAVSGRFPERLVLAGDQVLALENQVLHKAKSRDEALAQLRRLGGRGHCLHSALALTEGADIKFSAVSTVVVHMAVLAEEAIIAYADVAGARMLDSVGGYEIEGIGAALIERVDGDFFSVVGLPLLPLLAYCRSAGLIAGWKMTK